MCSFHQWPCNRDCQFRWTSIVGLYRSYFRSILLSFHYISRSRIFDHFFLGFWYIWHSYGYLDTITLTPVPITLTPAKLKMNIRPLAPTHSASWPLSSHHVSFQHHWFHQCDNRNLQWRYDPLRGVEESLAPVGGEPPQGKLPVPPAHKRWNTWKLGGTRILV